MKKTKIFDLRAADLENDEMISRNISRFGQFATDLTEGEEMIADIDLEEPEMEATFKREKEENIESVVFSKIERKQPAAEEKNKKHLSQLNSILEEMVAQMIEEKVQTTINKVIDEISFSITKMKK